MGKNKIKNNKNNYHSFKILAIFLVLFLTFTCFFAINNSNSANFQNLFTKFNLTNEKLHISSLIEEPFVLDWNTTWGGNDNDKSYGLTIIGDQVIIVGETASFGAGGIDGFIASYGIKNNSQLWNNTWGGADTDYFYKVVSAPTQNSVYVAGCTLSFGGGGYDAVLAKYWTNGTLHWTKQWGKSGGFNDWGLGIAISPIEEAIYITGDTNSHGAGGYDAYITKFDMDGIQIWNITWGKANADYGRGIATNGTVIYLSGYYQPSAGNFDSFIAAFNASNGDQIWNQTLGESLTDYSRSVFTDGTQAYITIYSQTYGNLSVAFDASNGTQIWNCSDIGYGQKIAMNNSELFVTGQIFNPNTNSIDAFIMRYNKTDGNQLQNWTYGKNDFEEGRDIAVFNNSIYMCGYVNNTGAGLLDAFLTKYEIDSLIPSIELDYPENNSVSRKPNFINLTIFDSHLKDNSFEWCANVTQTSWSPTYTGTFDINITGFATDQSVQFWVRVNDTANNQNMSSFILIFDDIIPEVQLDIFSNLSVKNKPNILNFTVSDTNLNQNSFEWCANVTQISWSPTYIGTFDINITDFATDQSVQFWVRVNDTANNQNMSSFILIFDDIIPEVQLDIFSNLSVKNKPNILNFTVSDTNLNQNSFEWCANVTQTSWSPTCIGTFDINITDFASDQVVQFWVRVNDTANNQKVSTFILIFDDIIPNVQMDILSNLSVIKKLNILNFTVFDTNLNQTSFEWRANVNQTTWTSNYIGSFDINITELLSDQLVQIWVSVKDFANNQIIKSYILIFDDTPPTKPSNPNHAIETDKIILIWTPSTDLHTISYQIWRDNTYLGTTSTPYFVDNIKIKIGTYLYRIIPIDEAWNQGEALEISIDTSTTIYNWILFLLNMINSPFNWWHVIFGLIIGLVAGLGAAFILLKRKNKEIEKIKASMKKKFDNKSKLKNW